MGYWHIDANGKVAGWSLEARRPRDTQRSRVYAWDKAMTAQNCKLASVLTLPEATKLILGVLAAYGASPAQLEGFKVKRNQRRYSFYSRSGTGHYISLRRNENLEGCLHEAAHAVVRYLYAEYAQACHGPVFARLLLELVSAYADRDCCAALAGIHRVRLAHIQDTPVPVVAAALPYSIAANGRA